MFTDFYCFIFQFFGSDFFLNGFPNPFIVHSRPSFLVEPSFFLASGFLFTCGFLALSFSYFIFSFFLEMFFPNSLIVRFRSRFLLVYKNSFTVLQDVSCYFFISSSRFLLRPCNVTITSNLLDQNFTSDVLMKRLKFFLVCRFLLSFWDCSSTKPLRLFSGNLPAMFMQFNEFELYWGAVFLRLEEEYWWSFCFIFDR